METNDFNISLTQTEAKELINDLDFTVYVASECAVDDGEWEAIGGVDAFVGRLRRAIEGA